MLSDVMMIILGMMIVTYIPRLLPFFVFSGKKINPLVEAFLSYVPYTALGALIFPGAIFAIDGRPLVSIIGLSFAGIYSYFKGGMVVTIVGSMSIVYLLVLM